MGEGTFGASRPSDPLGKMNEASPATWTGPFGQPVHASTEAAWDPSRSPPVASIGVTGETPLRLRSKGLQTGIRRRTRAIEDDEMELWIKVGRALSLFNVETDGERLLRLAAAGRAGKLGRRRTPRGPRRQPSRPGTSQLEARPVIRWVALSGAFLPSPGGRRRRVGKG
jgi:hypothetical protein